MEKMLSYGNSKKASAEVVYLKYRFPKTRQQLYVTQIITNFFLEMGLTFYKTTQYFATPFLSSPGKEK